MRRGEYGFDAPYAVVIFGAVAVASAVGATICWREGETRLAARMTLFSVFFLFNTLRFLYTTRRASSSNGRAFWIVFSCAATSECSIWAAVAARC
jgi:hypothetical protein